jgi:hypothetical protein
MPSPAEQPPGARPWWRDPLPPQDPDPEPDPEPGAAPWPGDQGTGPARQDDVPAAGWSPAPGDPAAYSHPVDAARTGPASFARPGDPALRSPYPGPPPQPAPHGDPERLLHRPLEPAARTGPAPERFAEPAAGPGPRPRPMPSARW